LRCGRNQIKLLVSRQSAAAIGLGLAVGSLGAWFSARFVDGMLFGITPYDIPTYGLVALVLVGVGWIASCLPARRAARVDPAIVLRAE
jgi:putative ABC transport system permease protein